MTLVYWGLDLAIVNAFYLWRMQDADNANKPQLGFRQQLIKELLEESTLITRSEEHAQADSEVEPPKASLKKRATPAKMAGQVKRHKATMSWFTGSKRQYCTQCYITTSKEKTPQVQCDGCGDLFCHSPKRDCFAVHAAMAVTGTTAK